MVVKTSPTASAQIAEIDAWWAEHRTKAPMLFIDELEAVLHQLGEHPYSGLRYEPIRGLYRVLLRRSGYHVYFSIRNDEIQIHEVLGARTARGPRR